MDFNFSLAFIEKVCKKSFQKIGSQFSFHLKEQDSYKTDDDALSAISSMSNTTITDDDRKENNIGTDAIHDEIDDIYNLVFCFIYFCFT